jgi:hypothetical protein
MGGEVFAFGVGVDVPSGGRRAPIRAAGGPGRLDLSSYVCRAVPYSQAGCHSWGRFGWAWPVGPFELRLACGASLGGGVFLAGAVRWGLAGWTFRATFAVRCLARRRGFDRGSAGGGRGRWIWRTVRRRPHSGIGRGLGFVAARVSRRGSRRGMWSRSRRAWFGGGWGIGVFRQGEGFGWDLRGGRYAGKSGRWRFGVCHVFVIRQGRRAWVCGAAV